jgi:sigma-E factor negative regulatory protein RseA
MSEHSRENLSSLMDGELDRRGRRFLLRRLAGDEELKSSWARMHTVRACLHQETLAAQDLVSRVADALDAEPAPAAGRMVRWLRPVAGTAIAASVAVAAIVGINASLLEQSAAPVDSREDGFVSRSTALDRPFTQSAVPVSYSEDRRAARQRISGYVLRHHQAAGSTGFVSYVPIVTGMDAGAPEREATASDERSQQNVEQR